jgi:hypothetical protein
MQTITPTRCSIENILGVCGIYKKKKYFVLIRLFETFSFGSMKRLLSFLLTGKSVYPRRMNILQYKILFFMVDLFVARGPLGLSYQLCHIYLQINWLPKYISVTYDRCANVYSNELDTKLNTGESLADKLNNYLML